VPIHRKRKPIRLIGYDYTQPGAYFVTICTHQRVPLFGTVTNGAMQLNACGRIAEAEWKRTAALRPDIAVDDFVVMPNHIHAIIVIYDSRDLVPQTPVEPHDPQFARPVPGSLGTIVGAYKAAVTRQSRRLQDTISLPLWQRNYHDHIIRTEHTYHTIRHYIRDNPRRWTQDTYHPGNI